MVIDCSSGDCDSLGWFAVLYLGAAAAVGLLVVLAVVYGSRAAWRRFRASRLDDDRIAGGDGARLEDPGVDA